MKYSQVREDLLKKQRELEDRLGRIDQHLTKPGNQDWSEQAQERENDEVLEAIGQEAALELRSIKLALRRMDEDEYELCDSCGETIPEARLKAMPFTRHCIRCAERLQG
ncbi:TraR/DksA family transcriptional regulator [Aestuariirhabdus litorea]|uniref:TraR/DksA family transcriptional regulator n=1 Tax=Aestuariirhabdus litorea TaxID=2528527 RepID=A0A3P3VR48_9GAMM|nr:TraR/DksA family transcriptional regulator [Aestuariirhabdus litorea]RRJ84448.1 TraR/DksA family transcriptional regulator [Aestuariirhabdus litorea]RWW97672.1 TraR/DksA family transcriptional regulator [Endozoicomonadaceae bacterium GTF-13]